MPALALRDLQASFWRSLHTGRTDPALVRVVLSTPTLGPSARIEVYQGMYFWRLHVVLREDFPRTAEGLGDAFEGLARRYLAEHPSENPSVRHLGRKLAPFLAADPLAADRPWLPDLARLERARVDAFDAPDCVPLGAADLRAIPPDAWADLRFDLIPALDVVESDWPVHDVWAEPGRMTFAATRTRVRVWREEFTVFHAAMDDVESTAFSALRAGAAFGSVCEAVAEHVAPDAAAAEAGALLARFVESGLIARVAP